MISLDVITVFSETILAFPDSTVRSFPFARTVDIRSEEKEKVSGKREQGIKKKRGMRKVPLLINFLIYPRPADFPGKLDLFCFKICIKTGPCNSGACFFVKNHDIIRVAFEGLVLVVP